MCRQKPNRCPRHYIFKKGGKIREGTGQIREEGEICTPSTYLWLQAWTVEVVLIVVDLWLVLRAMWMHSMIPLM